MKMENIADVLEMVEPRLQADESFGFLSLFPLVTVAFLHLSLHQWKIRSFNK